MSLDILMRRLCMLYVHSVSSTVVIFTLLLITMGLGPGIRTTWADKHQHRDEHQHTTPHGGQMVNAGQYFLEIVVKDGQTVQVYLYNYYMQPIAVPSQPATLSLRLPGNKRQTLTLEAQGSGTGSYLTTTADLHDVHTFEGTLRVALDGESRHLRFTYQDEHGETPRQHGPGR